MICFIIVQHAPDAICGQAHIHKEIRRNVPWAVYLVLVFFTDFRLHVLDIRNASEDNGLEGSDSFCITTDIAVTQHGKKVNEDLIVCRAINFIDNENQWLL